MKIYKYPAITAKQAPDHDVFVFAAKPIDILNFSQIERVSRKDGGALSGFQRHQISSHIKDIRAYMAREDAILPNAVIVAFLDNVTLSKRKDGTAVVSISTENGPPGFVVDGQQRLTALSGIEKPEFQVFVAALVCKNYDDMRQQFVLINSTRPLPKTLIYELLPTVNGLPERYTARRFAARVVERLNYFGGPALREQIKQHTNPAGMISDTAMQKLVMNSATNGAIRELIVHEDREDRAVNLIDQFFNAVAKVFGGQWYGMSPRHSRLRHGAGIVSMGFVMDLLFSRLGATETEQFIPALELLKPYTAWTSGNWQLNEGEFQWNAIENTPTDIDMLSRFLVSTTQRQLRKQRRAVNG